MFFRNEDIQEEDKDTAFALHKELLESIKKVFYGNIIDTAIRTTAKEKFLRDMTGELEYLKKEYFSEYGQKEAYLKAIDEIITKLNEMSFTKRRVKDLREIWRKYKQKTQNPRIFLRELTEFSRGKKIPTQDTQEEFDEKRLRLVCVDYIS